MSLRMYLESDFVFFSGGVLRSSSFTRRSSHDPVLLSFLVLSFVLQIRTHSCVFRQLRDIFLFLGVFLLNIMSNLLDPFAVRFLLELGCCNEFFKPITLLL